MQCMSVTIFMKGIKGILSYDELLNYYKIFKKYNPGEFIDDYDKYIVNYERDNDNIITDDLKQVLKIFSQFDYAKFLIEDEQQGIKDEKLLLRQKEKLKDVILKRKIELDNIEETRARKKFALKTIRMILSHTTFFSFLGTLWFLFYVNLEFEDYIVYIASMYLNVYLCMFTDLYINRARINYYPLEYYSATITTL